MRLSENAVARFSVDFGLAVKKEPTELSCIHARGLTKLKNYQQLTLFYYIEHTCW